MIQATIHDPPRKAAVRRKKSLQFALASNADHAKNAAENAPIARIVFAIALSPSFAAIATPVKPTPTAWKSPAVKALHLQYILPDRPRQLF